MWRTAFLRRRGFDGFGRVEWRQIETSYRKRWSRDDDVQCWVTLIDLTAACRRRARRRRSVVATKGHRRDVSVWLPRFATSYHSTPPPSAIRKRKIVHWSLES